MYSHSPAQPLAFVVSVPVDGQSEKLMVRYEGNSGSPFDIGLFEAGSVRQVKRLSASGFLVPQGSGKPMLMVDATRREVREVREARACRGPLFRGPIRWPRRGRDTYLLVDGPEPRIVADDRDRAELLSASGTVIAGADVVPQLAIGATAKTIVQIDRGRLVKWSRGSGCERLLLRPGDAASWFKPLWPLREAMDGSSGVRVLAMQWSGEAFLVTTGFPGGYRLFVLDPSGTWSHVRNVHLDLKSTLVPGGGGRTAGLMFRFAGESLASTRWRVFAMNRTPLGTVASPVASALDTLRCGDRRGRAPGSNIDVVEMWHDNLLIADDRDQCWWHFTISTNRLRRITGVPTPSRLTWPPVSPTYF